MRALDLRFAVLAIAMAISNPGFATEAPLANATTQAVPTIDLRPCLQGAPREWKMVGVTLELKWDGTVLSLLSCTPVDLSADPSSSKSIALTGEFPGAPGWEIQGANGAPLCRRTWDGTSQSLTCRYLIAAPPPPPRPGQKRAPDTIAGGTMAGPGGTYSKIPVLPGAAMLVVYDNPCGGDRDPNRPFTNQPLARFTLR